MYYTYMLRCKDDSIYTGYTNDLEKRMNDHFSKNQNGAKYTKSHDAKKLEIAWQTKEKNDACRLEYWIKRLTKAQKEQLIKERHLSSFLEQKISCELYQIVINNMVGKIDKS